MFFLAASNITESTGVSIGLVFGIIGLIVTISGIGLTLVGWGVRLLWGMSVRIDEIAGQIKVMTINAWTLDDQIAWDDEFRSKNPDTPIPDSYKLHKDARKKGDGHTH